MNHVTSIGLDVHSTSVTAAAFNPFTAEISVRTFGYDAAEISAWALSFDSPAAAYESGVTGFDLARGLNALGLPCVVAAVSNPVTPDSYAAAGESNYSAHADISAAS